MQNIKPVQKCAKYETCAICTGIIFCTFFETIFCNFEINGYFHFFFFGGGGGVGVAVEVILEGFISGIESFHIIYFYFRPINRICVLHRQAIKLSWRLTRDGLRGVTTFIQETRL